MKPLIGITADFQESGEFPSRIDGEGRYMLREHYVRAVADNGGEPVILPYTSSAVSLCNRIDGLLITGGAFDIPPELSGIKNPKSARKVRPERTRFEMNLLSRALRRDIPILGICGGMQLMAVAFRGKLVGDILEEVPGAFNHEQETPRNEPGHNVVIVANTLLHRVVKSDIIGVNSSHHQAVATSGKTIISAGSTDGIVEAIELPHAHFALGVEWHPELLYTTIPAHRAILRAFISAALSK